MSMIWLTLVTGCAISYGKYYRLDDDGTLWLCAKILSGVIGQGETKTFIEHDCVEITHLTEDTGVSDNAVELGGKIAEGLAKGAVKGIVPVP